MKIEDNGWAYLEKRLSRDFSIYSKIESYLFCFKSHKPAFRELETLAEDGVVSAQNRCGLCYEFGYSTPVAMERAVRWYRQAAEQGNPHGQYNLGLCYYHGRGVEKNNSEALKWCKLAAKQGHKEAKQMVKEIKK